MALPVSDHRKGLACAVSGGLLLACDIPVIRLADTDPWTVLALRGPLMAFVLAVGCYFLKRVGWSKANFYEGKDTIVLGSMHAIATVGFVFGIYYTTTANLVFITAFSSLIAIVFGTVIFRERHPLLTWLTIAVALFGIGVITVSDFVETDGRNTFGNMMALLCAIMLASEVIYVRRSDKNLVYAPWLSGLICSAFALPFAIGNGVSVGEPAWFAANALIVSPVAMALLTLAPRYMPAPEAAMFYQLETVFAPLLVWVVFLEVPSQNTLLGGAIVLSALLFHSFRRIKTRPKAAISYS